MASGIPPAAAPLIASERAVGAGTGAGAIVAAFYGLAFIVEPQLLRWSERFRARSWLVAWSVVCALVLVAAASTSSWWVFLFALAIYGPTSSALTAVAEGLLVESTPESRERTLARVMLAGGLGDLVVPVLLGAVALVHLDWRAALTVAALVAVALALTFAATRTLDRPLAGLDDDEDDIGDPPRLRDALRNRPLVGWALASSATNLMDEVMAAFAVVHIHRHVTSDPLELAIAIGAWISGGLVGVALLERALARVAPMRALFVTASLGLPAFGGLMLAPDVPSACVALAALGGVVSTYYPLVHARAYAAMPGHPGVVNGVVSLLSPLELSVPLALGLVADAAGSTTALALLALVPIAMVVVSALALFGRARE
ncbi:MAG: MFS transporter [Myxococcales bacterium]|nr:MFS transporter [Myxococcales bacterium]